MALKPELENLDGINEHDAKHYVEVEGGGFKLDLDGQVPAPELKKALEQERESNRIAKQENDRLKQEKADAEKKSLEDKQEYKTLWENEKLEKEQIKKDRLRDKKDFFVEKTVSFLTKDDKKATALRRSLQADVDFGPEGELLVKGIPEVTSTDQLAGYYKENLPFLTDGSQASGGGSTGGRSNGGSVGVKTLNQQEFDALDPSKKMEFQLSGGRVTQE